MRVLFLSRRYFPAISGMSIYAANLLRELVAQGHDVTMVSQYRDDDYGKSVYGGGPPPAVPGVRVVGLPQTGEAATGDFESDIEVMVETMIEEHASAPFDVIHAQYGYPTGWAALLAGREAGLPVVVSIQGGDGHWVGSCCECHRLAMTRVLDHADRVLIGGESFAAEVHERLGTPLERFTLIPGAVDTKRFTPGNGPGEGPVRLLYHGRVDARKGALDTLHALARLETKRDWRCTMSGIGPDLAAAKALADELSLGGRVSFTGYADYETVPDLYRAHDVFLSPTYAEGFSNTVLEAMASRHAILAGRSVGIVDCLRDGENGILVEPGDINAIARETARLVDDAQHRERLAGAALRECRETYSWAVVGRMIADQYEAVAGRTQARGFETALPRDPCRFRAEPHLL
ncbi:glycosyltransferase family 4 protein [Parvularcula dongshanensis]|uniref:Glycosyltransferase involved in cell wall biosynthesis n=1 Tax=Parvularcula dongshanensis TaxID=1173995 RepID=A0A840I2X4_9PROT|nr:glycosyltransferase family 4 protein [Parvularcula dongshanensis]MBB4658400.1 glycosyltransferase involved in cell wall biosynthesis [Parvularcula dongshanensis]